MTESSDADPGKLVLGFGSAWGESEREHALEVLREAGFRSEKFDVRSIEGAADA